MNIMIRKIWILMTLFLILFSFLAIGINGQETLYDTLSFGITLNVIDESNSPPQITNPYPGNGSTGIELTPTLQIDVNDSEGDTMDITWYTNLTDGWNNTFDVHQAEVTAESITTRMPHQRQSVYANGSYWIFYCEGSNGDKAYTSSTNGINWNVGTTFRNSQIGGADFSIAMVNDTILSSEDRPELSLEGSRPTPV